MSTVVYDDDDTSTNRWRRLARKYCKNGKEEQEDQGEAVLYMNHNRIIEFKEVTNMPGWKTVPKAAPADNLAEIMSEQFAVSLQEQETGPTVTEDAVDEDLILAQQLQAQFDEEIVGAATTPDDDLVIAQILQANEEEEKSRAKVHAKDTAAFEKVGTISAGHFDFEDSSKTDVHSSEWYKAVQLEKKLGKFDEEKQASITKHDPLIRALRSSEALTEFDGAGDLAGSKLLVSPSVGFTLRSFEKKQRKIRNDVSHQNRQKDKEKEKHKLVEVASG
jgi:hypothetical protein